MATALLLGPTGLVGSHLLMQLLEAPEYERVIALTRRPLTVQHPHLREVMAPLAEVEKHHDALQADDVFCCLGTTIRVAKTQEAFKAVDHDGPLALGRLQDARNQKRFFLISSLGADLNSAFFYSRVKAEVESDLAGLGFKRLYIARPSLLLGRRVEPRVGETFGELGSLPLVPLMRGPWRKYRPIQAATVADNLMRLSRGQEAREGMEWAFVDAKIPAGSR